ncbi:efflux RND transporter periplasmic adaptor subunit [Thermodesulfobacteriota bacterium]
MEKVKIKGKTITSFRSLLPRLRGAIPTLFVLILIGGIVILGGRIKTEGEMIKEKKAADLQVDRPKTNVVTMEMIPSLLREQIDLPGIAKPWISLKVVAEVSGKIVEKRVREGHRVEKGDALALIDARDYRNALASAKASYEIAVSTEKRYQALLKSKSATPSQLDEVIAKVRTSKAAMDNAALDLERCVIRSPMAGVVDRLYIENGQYMTIADAVADILEIDRVKVVVGIPESDVDAVRQLRHFNVTIDALNGRCFEGTGHYLYKTADSFARLYNLEIVVDNPKGEILPDMFARVEIVKKEVPEGLAVPLYALIDRNELKSVYVVDKGVALLRPVQVGIQDGWRMEIRKGLSPGDHVVVIGQRNINDGETVHVTHTVRDMEELTQ